MSAENGNGNGNGWRNTVLAAVGALVLGGGVGVTIPRETQAAIQPTITQAELTALKVFEAETKLRLSAHDKIFEDINAKLDTLVNQKESKR